jgi:V-type H+-transporting ATPase subunit a
MLLGTIMKGFNAIYFGRWVEFFFEVIAQIVLLCVLFGFMDYLIISKWLTDWA